MFRFLIISFFFVTVNSYSASVKVTKHSCSTVKKQMDNINSHMRRGYSVQQGEYLKERLRSLQKEQRQCKNKGYKIK